MISRSRTILRLLFRRELAARPEFIGSDNGDQARDTEERRTSELNDEAPLG